MPDEQMRDWRPYAGGALIVLLLVTIVFAVTLRRADLAEQRRDTLALERITAQSAAATARANAEAATARNDTAKLEAQTAQLRLRLQQERARRNEIESLVAWRDLPRPVAKAMGDVLAGKPASVTLDYIANDPEAMYFARQIGRIFQAAHWTVTPHPANYPDTLYFGVWLENNGRPETATAADALKAAGIAVTNAHIPPVPGATPDADVPVTLLIGSKQPVIDPGGH